MVSLLVFVKTVVVSVVYCYNIEPVLEAGVEYLTFLCCSE